MIVEHVLCFGPQQYCYKEVVYFVSYYRQRVNMHQKREGHKSYLSKFCHIYPKYLNILALFVLILKYDLTTC